MNKKLCSIVGYPLNNPRSVKIWTKYINKNNLNINMTAIEIDKPKFQDEFSKLITKKNFLSTLITMPFKKKILKFATNYDNSVKICKSANLLVKKNQNKFIAYNTDVIAAYKILKNKINNYNDIVIIGLGGTGQAIFKYLTFLHPDYNYYLITSKKKFKKPKNLNIIIRKKVVSSIIKKKSIIINATPLGSDLDIEYINKLPIGKKIINNINKNSLVFDVVYSPKITKLNKVCNKLKIKYISGLEMNTIQGKLAMSYVFKK